MTSDFWRHFLPSSEDDIRARLLATLLVFLLLWIAKRGLVGALRRQIQDLARFHFWRQTVSYSQAVLMVLLIGNIWASGIHSLGTFLGLMSAGLAIAMHDTIANLAGWVFLVTRRPCRVGDRIEIGGLKGDVVDIRPFQFSLLEIGNWVGAEQSTGRLVNVPNSKVLREPLANYSTGFDFIWNEIPVLLTFESDWRKAKKMLIQIAGEKAEHLTGDAEEQTRRAAMQYLIFFSKLTPVVYTAVRDSGVLLTIRYLVRPKRRRGSEELFWEAILDAFDQHADIDFAYPTTRYYHPGGRLDAPSQNDSVPTTRL
ncbi:MAG: small-conductance mechanosensitive channel [Candidatus Promineifilaceae bacterium]|jgi:small-conductance mechanosensitive channel